MGPKRHASVQALGDHTAVAAALESAPFDDEPESEDEAIAVAKARNEESISTERLLANLGIRATHS